MRGHSVHLAISHQGSIDWQQLPIPAVQSGYRLGSTYTIRGLDLFEKLGQLGVPEVHFPTLFEKG